MQSHRQKLRFLQSAFCLLLILALPGNAWAHGMGWQSEDSFSVVVQFNYDDGEPMAYGEVKIYSPETDQYAYQSGRSDRNGYFTFRPDQPGEWTFAGDDGQGHITEGKIQVTEADLTGRAENDAPRAIVQGGAQKPNMFQILLGLSVLANIALISLLLQAKKRRARTGTAGGHA